MSMQTLADAYRRASILFPELKAITLAQWILESGRGSSYLAKNYFNFGGLKYRAGLNEKVPGVESVFYDEGRGEDDKYYFRCKDEAMFIKLYWAFMGRAVYAGWEEAAKKGPIEYLTHIVFAGYLGGDAGKKAAYIEKIKQLIPEAKKLLKEGTKPVSTKILTGVKIAIDCGHGMHDEGVNDPGATGPYDTNERTEASFYANEAAKLLKELGASVSIFDYSLAGAPKLTLGQKGARAKGHDLFISCHLNSVDGGVAQGTETLYENDKSTKEDIKLAEFVQKSMVKALGFADRGVKKQGLGVLEGAHGLCKAKILCEAYFVNSKTFKSAAEVRDASKRAGLGLATGVAEYCKAVGLSTNPVPSPQPVPEPSLGGKHFLRQVKNGGFDSNGLQILSLQLCQMLDSKRFFVKDSLPIRSGLSGAQAFRVASESKSGSHEPLPEGYYKLGPVEWVGGKVNDYSGSWGPGMGSTWSDLIPLMQTERSALGVHLDTRTPGSEACTAIQGVENEKKYVQWRKQYPDIEKLTANYGLGTVETLLELVARPNEEPKPPTTPVPPTGNVGEGNAPGSGSDPVGSPSEDSAIKKMIMEALEKFVDWVVSLFKKKE